MNKMSKLKQSAFTFILVITCFVCSPWIYHKIWENSKEKKVKTNGAPPVVDIHRTDQQPVTPASDPQQQPSTEQTEQNVPADSTENATVTTASSAEGESDTSTTSTTVTTQAAFNTVEVDPAYFNDALFIGDSRTVGIRDYGTLKNADYFCEEGLASSGALSAYVDGNTLEGVLSSKTYGKVYIMLGINEVGNDFEYTLAAFRRIVDTVRRLQPNAVIYLHGNLHVSLSAETSAISNERINYLNSGIAAMADNQKIFYIDINPVFDDEYGALREECTGDGIHVLGMYYQNWCDWLCLNAIGNTDTAFTHN